MEQCILEIRNLSKSFKELKVLELQKNNAGSKELSKVEELLNKIEQEATNDIK